MYLHTVTLLESVGFTFGLDLDEELQIEYPLDFDPKTLADKLAVEHVRELTSFLKFRGQRARQQFLGGPLDGQPHSGLPWSLYQRADGTHVSRGVILHRTAPADWAKSISAIRETVGPSSGGPRPVRRKPGGKPAR